MRTRGAKKDAEANSSLGNLLDSLHQATHVDGDADTSSAAGRTLGDVSRQSVGKLLDRVGVRRAAAKKRQLQEEKPSSKRFKRKVEAGGDDELFRQRPVSLSSTSFHAPRSGNSADVAVCGTLAKTALDVEDCYMKNQAEDLLVSEGVGGGDNDTSMADVAEEKEQEHDDFEDDELEWEQGGDVSLGASEENGQNINNGWNGEVTIQMETPAEKLTTKLRKPPVRRASAKDKEFAELVHKSHLLCLLARGQIVDAACDNPLLQNVQELSRESPYKQDVRDTLVQVVFPGLHKCVRSLQSDSEFASHEVSNRKGGTLEEIWELKSHILAASLLSVLPPALHPSAEAEDLSAGVLKRLVSWFSSSFRVLSLGEGSSSTPYHGDFSKLLLEAVQKQAGSAEEVAALSVAFFRGLGFATRYVTNLEVASLKPDAQSLEASVDWDSEQAFNFSSHVNVDRDRVLRLACVLAQSSQQADACGNTKASSNISANGNGDPTAQGREIEDCAGQGERESVHVDGIQNNAGSSTKNNLGVDVRTKARPSQRGSGRGRGKGRSRKNIDSTRYQEVTELESASEVRKPENKLPEGSSVTKGDEEFERNLALAMCATAAASKGPEKSEVLEEECASASLRTFSSVKKQFKDNKAGNRRSSLRQKLGMITPKRGANASAAVPQNMGPMVHWAEIYLSEDGNVGRWIHVDAARGIVDGAEMVENSASSNRLPLCYIVAFAGTGAKDVTRRYVALWSTVSSLRVDGDWWDTTLHPLKQLEAAATAGATFRCAQEKISPTPSSRDPQQKNTHEDLNALSSGPDKHRKSTVKAVHSTGSELVDDLKATKTRSARGRKVTIDKMRPGAAAPKHSAHLGVDRAALEDMEMQTKTFTEPLPTSQQAYKSHHLYVLERWLTKYQTLHPKGPVLGYCAGQPVYPRTSVQILHTPDRWLREGLKVRAGEAPAKVVKANHLAAKSIKASAQDLDGVAEKAPAPTTDLFGKWQCDPWRPPAAVNGIVPKNERGQIDAWSEYCIPPGTVHLRYPRLVPIVKKLGFDFAPAMVGFEIRQRRSVPMYEGVVVCEEFKDVIMEAYEQEEERRFGALRRKRQDMAVKRWRQLLFSMATRRRLEATYANSSVRHSKQKVEILGGLEASQEGNPQENAPRKKMVEAGRKDPQELPHVHHFPEEDQSYDEESGTRTKQCSCGFTIQVEEM